VPSVCVGVQEYFRDVYDHLLRISQQLDGLRDMVVTALSVNLSMITLSENEVVKRLASYAALVAVPTLIAGIYGMNFKNMPELDWFFGYPLALFLMFGIDGLLFLKFRKTGWL
jgi:magnesium transporter